MLHTRVRHRAEKQFAEKHSVRVVVFGVLRQPSDFGVEVGRWIILADQSVSDPYTRSETLVARLFRHDSQTLLALRIFSAPRISAVRILS